MPRPVHVMVAILRDRAGRILITSRPEGKPQAGRWEFPGGKLEAGESPEACLRRELLEELGIVAGPMQPLIAVSHDYGDFRVHLDVREVRHFGGEPRARENQRLKWTPAEDLPGEDILEADRPIIQALRLPDAGLVTPDASSFRRQRFLADLDASLADTRLVQLRSPGLEPGAYLELAREVLDVCRRRSARLLLNAPPALLESVAADGIHLTSRRLMSLAERPVDSDTWLSASCHSITELRHAERIGVDFALLGPVAATATHPGAPALGWAGFTAMAAAVSIPVYALGGLASGDITRARAAGARGVAGIRAFWKGSLSD